MDQLAIPLAGVIAYDEELTCLSLNNRPVSEIKSDKVKGSIKTIMDNITGE